MSADHYISSFLGSISLRSSQHVERQTTTPCVCVHWTAYVGWGDRILQIQDFMYVHDHSMKMYVDDTSKHSVLTDFSDWHKTSNHSVIAR